MEKIIINPQNFNAVEVSLNGRFAPCMGLNQQSFRQLVIKENELLQKLGSITLKAKLPKDQLKGLQAETKKQQIVETQKILQKVMSLMKDGFRVAIILDILKITIGKSSAFGSDFERRFEPLYRDAECREDFWGSKEPIPFMIVIALIGSLMSCD